MNSINDFYRLFCLFKSVEGLKHVRTKIDKFAAAKQFRLMVRRNRTRIPDDLAKACMMPDIAGKSLGDARDTLWDLMRNSLAHLDLETGKFVSLHTIEDLYTVRRVIPLLQYIVKASATEETKAYTELVTQLGSIVVL